MAFKGLTMNTPASDAPHIYAEDQAAFYKCLIGDASFILPYGDKFKTTITGATTIRVSSGALSLQGHLGLIPINDYEDFTLKNGTAGKTRKDLLVATFETTGTHGTDKFYLEVLTNTANYEKGNLEDGALKAQMPLATITMEGLSAKSVTMFDSKVISMSDVKFQVDGIGNKVDEAIDAAIKRSEVVLETENFGGNNLELTKVGSIVNVSLYAKFLSVSSGSELQIGTVPEKFRPSSIKVLQLYGHNPSYSEKFLEAGTVQIGTNGLVKAYVDRGSNSSYYEFTLTGSYLL